jgi:SAM-dependent methyltransferase
VLDVGAGTGKLTRPLLERGLDVIAVEPVGGMRATLQRTAPAADIRAGQAEALPLEAGAVDAVVAGQAFHWFDPEPALREIARVLRPGGTLGLIWNVRDESEPWVVELSELIGGERGEDVDVSDVIDPSGLFEPVEREQWPWRQPLDRARLQDLVLSRSYCAALPEDERRPVLEAVERLYDAAAASGGLFMPYVAFAFRAAKRAS